MRAMFSFIRIYSFICISIPDRLTDIATGITLLISCIGLFGLTLFTTARRTREIGIRKVMGARVTDILTLLGMDFVVLMLIALMIASACGWYGMHRRLQDYAYRV